MPTGDPPFCPPLPVDYFPRAPARLAELVELMEPVETTKDLIERLKNRREVLIKQLKNQDSLRAELNELEAILAAAAHASVPSASPRRV